MPEFAYTARRASGEDVAGTMTAASKREALASLAEQALFPLHVEGKRPARAGWSVRKRIKPQAVATNLNQLADLLQNGLPLLSALDLLAQQASVPSLGEVFADVRDQVSEGTALEDAFAAHPAVFNDLALSMVRAGAEGAFLEDALKRTASFLELQQELKARFIGAMSYPAFLAFAGLTVTTILVVFFVPKFAQLFARLERQGGGLPWPTVVLLFVSDTLRYYGWLVTAGLVGLVFSLRGALRSQRGRLLVDRWKLKIPVVGSVFLGFAVSRFCRVLGTLLRNGVPLLKALDISSQSAGNAVLARAIRESAENISAGETLAAPLAGCGLIPRSVMAMITIAEQSNNLEEVLISVADGIDRTNARQLDIMVRMVEPIMLLVMGTAIGFVLVALLLPVFDASAAMG